MHLFHKWWTEYQKKTWMSQLNPLTGKQESVEVVLELQKCRKCDKKRGFVHYLDGSKKEINPTFICKEKGGN